MQIIKDILNHSNINLMDEDALNLNTVKTLISEHALWGQINTPLSFIKSKKKQITLTNIFFNDQFNSFKKILIQNNIKTVVPLKGISLINQVYNDWGQRRLSDIDVYIPSTNKNLIHSILTNNGFKKLNEIKWQANKHKVTYTKDNNFMDVTIEVHFKLFSHCDHLPSLIKINNSDYLSKVDELLYLCYHLAEQHNFIKLFWLKDISLFIEKFHSQIDWSAFHKKSKELKIFRSTETCLFLAHKHLKAKPYFLGTNYLFHINIDWNYLCNPYKSKIKYFLLKNYLKGSRSLPYLFNWFKAYKY